jgi:hypothetical protein
MTLWSGGSGSVTRANGTNGRQSISSLWQNFAKISTKKNSQFLIKKIKEQ